MRHCALCMQRNIPSLPQNYLNSFIIFPTLTITVQEITILIRSIIVGGTAKQKRNKRNKIKFTTKIF